MSKDEEGYNGWKNYETWLYKLWLDNDEGNYRYWQERAREVKEESKDKDERKMILSDSLEENIWSEIETQLGSSASFIQDLVNSAVKEIDFYEIAENLLSD